MKKSIKWSEIMEANADKIIEKMIQAKEEAEGTMQGWSVGVEMDDTGDVWTTGLMSQGSQSASSFNGETYNVTAIQSWKVEYDEAEFFQERKNSTLKKEFEEQREEGTDYVRQFMLENHPDTLDEWDKEAAENENYKYAEGVQFELEEIIENCKRWEE